MNNSHQYVGFNDVWICAERLNKQNPDAALFRQVFVDHLATWSVWVGCIVHLQQPETILVSLDICLWTITTELATEIWIRTIKYSHHFSHRLQQLTNANPKNICWPDMDPRSTMRLSHEQVWLNKSHVRLWSESDESEWTCKVHNSYIPNILQLHFNHS